MPSVAPLLLFTIVGLLIFVWTKKQKWKICSPKLSSKHIPSDPGIPLIGHLYQIFVHGTGFIHLLQSWTVRHGDICMFSFGPWKQVVLINNANMIQQLLTSKEHLARPPFIYHKVFGHSELFRLGLTILDVPRWKDHRAILNRAFTYNPLKTYIPILNKFGRELVSQIKNTPGVEGGSETFVSLQKLIDVATIRIISYITLGEIIFTPEHLQDTLRLHDNLDQAKLVVTQLITKPWLFIKPIWHFHPFRKQLLQIKTDGENYFSKIISRAKSKYKMHYTRIEPRSRLKSKEESIKPRETFRSLIELMMEEGDLSEAEICGEALTFTIGGHDSTSTSMMFLMYNLSVNPDCQRECQREVDAMFEMESSTEMSLESFQNLKYLERCIKESLRLYPTFPLFARESTTSTLKLSDQYTIEPGVIIMVSPWTLHRNPEYFPNPEKFDPDRFLPENAKKRSSYAYMSFSAGSRDCVGRKLAIMELIVLSSWILRHFDVSAEPNDPNRLKVQFGISLTTDPKIKFALKRRLVKKACS